MSLQRVPILRHGLTQWDKTLVPRAEIEHRVERVRKAMRERGIDLLLAYSDQAHGGNVGYLSNFQVFDPRMPAVALVTESLLEAVLKVASRDIQFLSPHLWVRAHPCDFVTGNLGEKVLSLAAEYGMRDKPVGVAGSRQMPLELLQAIRNFFGEDRIKDVDGMLESLRREKSASERCLMRLAAAKAEAVLAEVIRHASPGTSERSLAAFADYAARKAGAQEVEFLVYGAGDHASSPWPRGHFPFRPPEARALPPDAIVGLFLVIQFHGYWVELSQSVVVGRADYEKATALDLSRSCFEDALAQMRAGSDFAAWPGQSRSAWMHGIGLDREEAPSASDRGTVLAGGDIAALHIAVRGEGNTVFFGRPVLVSEAASMPLFQPAPASRSESIPQRTPKPDSGHAPADAQRVDRQELDRRYDKLRALMSQNALDTLLVFSPPLRNLNVHYASNYDLIGAGALVAVPIAAEPVLYISEEWDLERAARVSPLRDIRFAPDLALLCGQLLRKARTGIAGLEFADSEFVQRVRSESGGTVQNSSAVLERAALLRTPLELELIREAAALADRGFLHGFEALEPGIREFELAAEIEYAMRGAGAIDNFGLLSSGTHNHAIGLATTRRVESGDLLIFEITPARLSRNYSAQLCKTMSAGAASRAVQEKFAILEEALQAALQEVKAGALARDIAKAQNAVISRYGYGDYCKPPYMRARGHGFGIGRIDLTPGNEQPLEAGMAIVVHPNQYFPDVGYLAYGHMVIVTEQGFENISRLRPGVYERT